MTTVNQDDPIDALDAIHEALALFAAEHGVSSEDDRMRADCLRFQTQRSAADVQRRRYVLDVARSLPDVRLRLVAMTRSRLLSELREQVGRFEMLELSTRRLKRLSEDDLRRLLETLYIDRS